MKQVECVKIGPLPWENVAVVDRPASPLRAGQARVAVRARPIDPADLLLLEGRHLARPTLPAVVGIEGAGIVTEVAADVDLAVGTPVAIPFGGTWREEMVFSASELLALPPGTDLFQASMLAVNPFTAVGLLEGLHPGDWVLQNAGTSSVARLVTRLSRERGVRTISVVRSMSRAAELAGLGADAVLEDGADLTARVRAVTRGAPIVRALDAVAGEASRRMFACLGDGGELVVYGLLADDSVQLPAAELVFRPVTVRGFSRLRIFGSMDSARRREIGLELARMLGEGLLETEVEARYPLESVADALRHHARADRRGKILLVSE